MYFNLQVAKLDSKAVFYWALAPMVLFYTLFAAVLLPNADALQPVAQAAKYCTQLVSSLAPCMPSFWHTTMCQGQASTTCCPAQHPLGSGSELQLVLE